jgi:hypothetical protein
MSQPSRSTARSRTPRRVWLRRLCVFGAALSALTLSARAGAEEELPSVGLDGDASAQAGQVSFAAGVSLGFLRVQELGSVRRFDFVPSLVGLAYVPVAPRVFLRPGVRFGYAGLEQAQFSHGAAIEERSMQAMAELGVQYDAWLVPALSVGGGVHRREIDFVGRGIVADSDVIDRTEWLGLMYAQLGLGLPLLDALIVVEPYVRVQGTFSDERSLLQLGTDITIGF